MIKNGCVWIYILQCMSGTERNVQRQRSDIIYDKRNQKNRQNRMQLSSIGGQPSGKSVIEQPTVKPATTMRLMIFFLPSLQNAGYFAPNSKRKIELQHFVLFMFSC
jgi:hypothetical protein